MKSVETLKAEAENQNVAKVAKKAPVKVSDLFIEMVKSNPLLSEEQKTALLGDFAKVTAKVTTAGRINLTDDFVAAVKNAGKEGISRNAIYNVLAAKYPEMVKEGPFAITDKLFPIYQPKNLEKLGLRVEGNTWTCIYFVK